jgi:hypothetical protein
MPYAGTHSTDAVTSVPPAAFMTPLGEAAPAVLPEPTFEVTHSSVRMDGRNLWREPFASALDHVIEAIRVAELRGKSELLMSDVTPWVKIVKGEISNVPETQKHVEELISRACARLKRDIPEIRLTLRGGEFDIRCYLGREKPSDHVFEDDWNSDSR